MLPGYQTILGIGKCASATDAKAPTLFLVGSAPPINLGQVRRMSSVPVEASR